MFFLRCTTSLRNGKELLELRDAIKRNIRKFDSLDEFENWYNTVDILDFIEQATTHFPCSLSWRNNE